MQSYLVGPYLEEEIQDGVTTYGGFSPLLDAQRTLAHLLGFHASRLALDNTLTKAEMTAHPWLTAPFLQSGLQVLLPPNPFEEEKGEVRSSSSTPGLSLLDD